MLTVLGLYSPSAFLIYSGSSPLPFSFSFFAGGKMIERLFFSERPSPLTLSFPHFAERDLSIFPLFLFFFSLLFPPTEEIYGK